jgi:hypothetical protein
VFDGRGGKRWVGRGYLEEGAISESLDHPHLHLLFNLYFPRCLLLLPLFRAFSASERLL